MHRRLFGRAVEFGHRFSGIVCNATDLDIPNPGADAVMMRYSQRLLAQKLDTSSRMTDRVHQLVVVLLQSGCVASRWWPSTWVWTGARWRAGWPKSGSRSATLVNVLRRELFARCLRDGTRSLTEVSALLGFFASSAFSRWHRQQFGVAARQLRSQRAGTARRTSP